MRVGGFASSRNPLPIGLTVLNTNSQMAKESGHICYMPVLSTAELQGVDTVLANHLIRQGCINAIVERIESIAKVEFSCKLPGRDGAHRIRRCKPFLCSMQLDSKETYAYAGL